MNDSRLEPYRDEILLMKMQGISTAAIQREIEQRHRVAIKKTQFYEFVNQVTNGAEPEPEEEFIMPTKSQPLHNAIDEEARTLQHTLLMKLDEVRRDLAKVITWQAQLDEREERREQTTREALQQFQQVLADAVRQMEAARATVRPAEASRSQVSPPITSAFRSSRPGVFSARSPLTWKRALLYTGMLWGAAVLLFVYGYWRPLWDAVLGLSGFVGTLTLHT
jgi:flagellar motility protein MotE (MotC chaperone)